MKQLLKPIHCPKCGKILLKPTEMGEVEVRCEECQKTFRVEPELNWEFWEIDIFIRLLMDC